ncbi:Cleavage and polyadenylation specificity factor subunit 1 [Smittium culicis]|uniref:Cleavage and polyadenylation specificity factor subunit 1 n=1 Tax=Smittium culicis TaxID=133412 RepID=A0A1R1YDX0_9FUNG|nr:Cleavage and polyadenylation specificity factor subunit 1 [Smittium culicis]
MLSKNNLAYSNEELNLTEENISTLGQLGNQSSEFEPDYLINPDYWLVSLDSAYTLRVYLLPTGQLIWSSDRIDLLNETLTDSFIQESEGDIGNIDTKEDTKINTTNIDDTGISSVKRSNLNLDKKINQIRVVSLGKNLCDLYLVLLTSSSEVIVYKSFDSVTKCTDKMANMPNGLKLKFYRIHSNLFTYYPDYIKISRKIRGWDIEKNNSNSQRNNFYSNTEVDPNTDATENSIEPSNETNESSEVNYKDTIELEKVTTFEFKHFEFNSLIHFSNIGGYSGLFIIGATPLWLLVGKKNFPRLHPMRLVPIRNSSVSRSTSNDEAMENFVKSAVLSSITGWAPLNGKIKSFDSTGAQINKNSLFVATTWSGTLVIGSLPSLSVDYDSPWPLAFMPIGNFSGVGSLGSLAYHQSTKNYVVVSTKLANFYLKENYSDNATSSNPIADNGTDAPTENNDSVLAYLQKDNLQPQPQQQQNDLALIPEQKRPDLPTTNLPPISKQSTLELLSPITFETIDIFDLEPNEVVTSMKSLILESMQTDSGKKNFLVVGTTFVLGEDILTRGNILIFDIISIVPDPNNPQRTKKFKKIYKEELRGGVSSLESIQNHYLIVGVGNKLFIRSFRDNENLEEPSKIMVLGRDTNGIQVSHADFLVHNSKLAILVADIYGNIFTFVYDPNNIHSFSGQKLLKCDEYHLGSNVTYIKRLVGKLDNRLWANANGAPSKMQGSLGKDSSDENKHADMPFSKSVTLEFNLIGM